jgi:hypothetical protein
MKRRLLPVENRMNAFSLPVSPGKEKMILHLRAHCVSVVKVFIMVQLKNSLEIFRRDFI